MKKLLTTIGLLAMLTAKADLTNNAEAEWVTISNRIAYIEKNSPTNYTKQITLSDAGASGDNLYRIVEHKYFKQKILVPVTVKEIYNGADPQLRAKLLRASYEWRNEDSTNVMSSSAWSMSFKNGTHGPHAVIEVLPGSVIGKTYEVVADRTNYINQLIREGEFCKIVGHAWGQHLHVTLEYAPNRISCRQCGVCKLHQEQYATEWK